MKKNYALAACLLILFIMPSVARAQSETFVGIKFGANVANLAGPGSSESLTALHGGFYLEFKPLKRLSIQPEALYSRQGMKTGALKYNFDYINVPLMLNLYVIEKFYVQAGPQFGYLVAAEVTDNKDSYDLKDQINTTDTGIAAGLGYKFGTISISARYNHGLSTVPKRTNTYLSAREDFPNRVFQFSLGVRLK